MRREETKREEWRARISAVRQQSDILWLHLYCLNPACPVRHMKIEANDMDLLGDALLRFLDMELPRCPVCSNEKRRLELLGVQTKDAHENQERLSARGLVAVQMWERDHKGAIGFPADVLVDERLPPTPPGWWETKKGDA
jgi:hypothetical protein